MRYYAACCQTAFDCPRSSAEIGARVDQMLTMVDHAVQGYEPFFPVRLVVFPEFAHAAPIYFDVATLRAKLAVPIPNEYTDRYQRKAAQLGIYIQTGTFIERHDDFPDALFNTTCLIGPDGIITVYRKTHPWIPWEVHASPHDLPDCPFDPFPVADTEIGKLGVAICYDWLFPEVLRQYAARGAEVLVRVSAYMDPWGTQQPMDWWTIVNRCRALENVAYVVACNQGADYRQYPPFSWPGGSMIVDFDGRILAQAESGPGERIVVGPIDLDALRRERRRREGHLMPAHLRTELYRCYRERFYPPAATRHAGPLSIEANRAAIREARERWLGLTPESRG